MYLSNSCLAEAYCQADYTPDRHDLCAEAFCRAIATHDSKKGDFDKWVGIQRSRGRREDWRLRQRVGYLEELHAANEEVRKIFHQEESSELQNDCPVDAFLTSAQAIFNVPFRKERKKIIKDLLSSVDRRSRIIILKRFFDGKNLKRIAAELRITKSTVQRNEKKTLHIFRDILSKKNVILDDLIL